MNKQIETPARELSWCRKCLTGFRNTTICPQCKADSAEQSQPMVRQFLFKMFRTQLYSEIPDLPHFVQQMKSGALKDLLENISEETEEESELGTEKIGPFDFQFWCDMQPMYQPSEAVRAVIYELSNQLSAEVRTEFLSRPQVVALNFRQAFPLDQQFSQDKYSPLPPLKLIAEEEALKDAFRYLATREALSCENWQDHFPNALAHGMLCARDVEAAKETWRQMARTGQHVERPLTPWLLTLKRLDVPKEERDTLEVFAGCANHCMQAKNYWAAAEIAQATLKLAHEVSDAEGHNRDKQRRDSLLFSLKGILANCAAMSDDDDDLAVDRARNELIAASMESFSETMDKTLGEPLDPLQDPSEEYVQPQELQDAIENTIAPMLDVLVQLKFADQCFNDGAIEKAEVKYNRIIFTLKGAFEVSGCEKRNTPQSCAERIMKVLPELIMLSSTCVPLVRATIRLAELKIKQSQMQAAEELLESALYYANATVQRSTSTLADLKNRCEDLPLEDTLTVTDQISTNLTKAITNLKVVIYGNLIQVNQARGQQKRAEMFAKKTKKLLPEIKPSDLVGFAISHAEIEQLCEKLKK